MKSKSSLNEKREKIASDIKAQHKDLTVDTFLVFDSTHEVVSRYHDMYLGNQTVSQTGLKVLNAIISYGGSMIPTSISKKIFRSKHSVSKAIFTLESHGLVEVKPVDGDRRKREVMITERGLFVAKRGNIYVRKRVSKEVMKILNKDEISLMNDILKRVRKHTLTLIKMKAIEKHS